MKSKRTEKSSQQRVADQIAYFIAHFTGNGVSTEEFDEIIDTLLDFDDEALAQLSALLDSPEEDTRLGAIVLLQELEETRAIPALRRMLNRPDYRDEEKIIVMEALRALGSPVDERTFKRIISDPEAVFRRSLERMLSHIDTPQEVEDFLSVLEEERAAGVPLDVYINEMLTPIEDRRLMLLFTALLYHEADDIVLAAIDALERLKEPRTIPLLEERAQYDPSKKVCHAAQNAALRLRTRLGPLPTEEGLFPWIPAIDLPFYTSLLSAIDGDGGQVLFVTRQRPDNHLLMLDVMFNDHEGIKDCFTDVLDEEELEDGLKMFGNLEFVEISLERTQAEATRAYRATLEAHRRPSSTFVIWQGMLAGDTPFKGKEWPLPTLDPAQQEKLLNECDELLALDEFEHWFFNPDEVAPFIARYKRLKRKNRAEPGHRAFEDLIDQVLTHVCGETSTYRKFLPDRLRHQAWLLRQIYEDEDGEELALLALAAATAIQEDIILPHPLLRAMAEYSLINATNAH